MMRKSSFLVSLMVLMALAVMTSCSGGSNPVSGKLTDTNSSNRVSGSEFRDLWGYWTVTIDPLTGSVEVVPLRGVTMHVNAVDWMQPPHGKLSNLGVTIQDQSQYLSQGRLDVLVTLTHPFPGLDTYTGFDVMGVFMTDGHKVLHYNSAGLTINDRGVLDGTLLNPDGYTRWWNQDEFTDAGIPILSYIPGALGIGASTLDARLNPYKKFQDGEIPDQDDFLYTASHLSDRGKFGAGAANSRLYQLKWPVIGGAPQLKFDYAVVASWEPPSPNPPVNIPGDFPVTANALEPVAISVTDNSDLVYDETLGITGGDISLDVEVLDWQTLTPGVTIEDIVTAAYLEILPCPAFPGGDHIQISPLTWSNGSTVNTSTVNMDFTGLTTSAYGTAPVLVILETVYDYDNGFGTGYPAGQPLTSYFEVQVPVSQFGGNQPPMCEAPVPEFASRVWTDIEQFDAVAEDGNGDPVIIDWSVEPTGNSPVWVNTNSNTILVNWAAATSDGTNLGDYDVCVSVYNGEGGAMCCTTVTVDPTATIDPVTGQSAILLSPQPVQGTMTPDITVYDTGSSSVGETFEQSGVTDRLRQFDDGYTAGGIGIHALDHSGFPPQLQNTNDWRDWSRFDVTRNGQMIHIVSGDDTTPAFTSPTALNINDPAHGLIMTYYNQTGVVSNAVIVGDLGSGGAADPDDNSTDDNRWKHLVDWTNGVNGLSNTRVYGWMTISEIWPVIDHSGNMFLIYSNSPFNSAASIDVLTLGGLSTHDIPAGDINDTAPDSMSLGVDDGSPYQADFIQGTGEFIDTIQVFYVLSGETTGTSRKVHILLFPENYDDPAWLNDPNAVFYYSLDGWLGAGGAYGVDFGTLVPMDIEVANNNDSGEGLEHNSNWVAVLLDDPSGGWRVNVYRYDPMFDAVALVTSYEYSSSSTGLRLDVDDAQDEIHVLHQDGGQYRVSVLEFTP